MSHPGQGLPSALIQDMFERGNQWTTQEGLGLNLSRKLLNRMNGQVHYVREHNICYFLIDLELKLAKKLKEGSRQLKAG
jgi:phytochrome E